MQRYLSGLVIVLLAGPALAASPDLELVMSDPDWIGHAPESPYWSDSGTAVYFSQKRDGERIRDLKRIAISGGRAVTVGAVEATASSDNSRVYNRQRNKVAWIHRGDVLVRDLGGGQPIRLTSTVAAVTDLQFMADDNSVSWLQEGQHWISDLDRYLNRQTSDIRYQDDPESEPDFDALRRNQERTYATLREDKRREDSQRAHTLGQQRDDPDRPPPPIYLGESWQELARSLSPSGRHLLLVVEKKQARESADGTSGRSGAMPNYVTADGDVTVKEVRTRVSLAAPASQYLLMVDLVGNSYRQITYDKLAGIGDDPLSSLRREAVDWHVEHGADRTELAEILTAPISRPLRVLDIRWNRSGEQVALHLLAVDNKDRWLASVAAAGGELKQQHRLRDSAWVNWDYNEFGWLPDDASLWYLSEQSGYSHLYRKRLDARRARQLTQGNFVLRDPVIGAQGRYAYVIANRTHPGNYEVYQVPLTGGELRQLTALDGVSQFWLSPSGRELLLRRSYIDRHPDLYIKAVDPATPARRLTDTVSARFKAIDWVIPEIVEVPSSHTDRPIYSKLYLPRDYDPGRTWPAVMFVHGAGYLQNSHRGWSSYFREFMFHTILANAGYIVIDMDYRASRGYGRDWRTAIYRQMGHPELEDLADGLRWLVREYRVDPERVGIYGGSYGGFMTLMALFRTPDLFAAGAALRPVVDWMHYKQDYTSRILNTPEIDPLAYQRSSPIHHAEGLSKPLLIASGIQDENVFFQDSVLLVQRLIELRKENFEIAIYPLDGHGFVHPASWLDEYRRVFKLMERHLK